eukprot:CAMPEP_0202728798 /NCGR_PEP_ID=MMETSP1385-20130828/185808_1 /ASSEMBLY_ACC=CAM_ASM_000861 /TAXON_ID=933848 /ORGANISM="Elphidium margaritaceum" /LENGTH=1771 /DNA_ID=CAMNT_0049395049 /DNA_START=27 /DNA_END=5342 /DNA_ORIENTATION=+
MSLIQRIHATSQYPTHFLTAKHILIQSGSILSCVNVDNGEQQFLLELNRFESISCLSSNPTHNLLAIAIQSTNASRIEVYAITTNSANADVDIDDTDSISLQLKYTFTECCVVGYSHLCMSNDAQFMIAASNIPALEIELWSIADQRKLSTTNAPADNIRFLTFSPTCNELFITATNRTVVVWRIYFKFDRYFLTSTLHSPPSPPQQQKQTDQEQSSSIHSLTFGADGTQFMYINERNRLFIVDESGQLQLEHTFAANDAMIAQVFYTRYYYILLRAQSQARTGLIEFFNKENMQLVYAKTFAFNFTHCVWNPNYREIVVFDDMNTMHNVTIDKVLLLNNTLQRIENDALVESRRVCQFVKSSPSTSQVVTLQCQDHVVLNTSSQLQLMCVSAAEDDVARAEDVPLSHYANICGVCALQVHHYKHGIDLLALGFNDGHFGLCLASPSDEQPARPNLKFFFLERISTCRVTQIEFNADGTLIACVSNQDNKVWFLQLARQNKVPKILGFYKLPQAPLCCCWLYDAYDNLKLILAFKNGYVMTYDAPEPAAAADDGDGDDQETYALDAYFVECEMDFSLLKIVRDPTSSSPDRIICITEDKKLRAFFLDDDATIFPDDIFVFDEHVKTITDIAIYGDLLLTASQDGQLFVRYLADASEVVLDLYAHQTCAVDADGSSSSGSGGGGVASVTFVRSGAVIVSVGYDGAVLSWRLNEELVCDNDGGSGDSSVDACECPLSAEFLATLNTVEHAADASNALTFLQKMARREHATNDATAADGMQPIVDEIQNEVANLQNTYDDIVQRVQNGSELERLTDAELIVDNAEYKALASANQREIDGIREDTRYANIGKQLVSRRIKEQCWDAMKERRQVVNGLKTKDSVCTFPILATTENDVNVGVRLQFLRTMNIMEREWCMKTNDRVKHEFDVTQPLSDPKTGYVWDVHEYSTTAAAVATEKDDSANATAVVAAGSDDEHKNGQRVKFPVSPALKSLMYHPLQLYTNFSKRIQMYLLNQRIRETKSAFNLKVKVLHQTKTGQVERINEMALEMKEIQNELEIVNADTDEIFMARCDDEEDEKHMFVVRAHEMQNKKNDHMKQSQKQNNVAPDADHQNVASRALQDMMHNTLERKDEVERLEDTLKRPEFMDTIDASQWTDAQKTEIEKYEEKKQTLLKAKEVRTKLLRTRLKALKNDVSEIIKNFDEQLKELYNLRLCVLQDVYVHQLMRIHLANDIVEYEKCGDKLRTMQHELMRLREDQHKADATYQEFDGKLQESKKKLDDLHAAEKYLERAFKKEMSSALSSDYFEYLYKLFRGKKAVPPKHGNISSKLGSIGGMDRKMSAVSSTTNDSNSTDVVSMRRSGSKQSTTANMSRRRSMSRSSMKGVSAADTQSEATDEMNFELNHHPMPADILLHDLKEDEFEEEDEQEIMQRKEDEIINPYFVAPASDLKATSTLLALQNLTKPIDLSWQVWSKFLEFRKLKMGKEQEIQDMSEQIASMQSEINALRANQGIIAESIQEIERGQRALREAADAYKLDCELFLHCRRGCVEVRECPIVTDYRGSVLIDRGVIEELNGVILKAGREQIEQLHEIKKFRRGINMLNWRAKVLDLEHHYFSLLTTEYQLRRVTKKDQEVIKGGGPDSTQKTQVSTLGRKLEFTKTTMEGKIRDKKKQFNKYATQSEKIRKSNQDLMKEIERMRSDVRDKENIADIRGTLGVQEQKKEKLQKRMDAVATRRKLTDLVAAQNEEIQFLRNELDRLRQKTFPSFSIVDTDNHI